MEGSGGRLRVAQVFERGHARAAFLGALCVRWHPWQLVWRILHWLRRLTCTDKHAQTQQDPGVKPCTRVCPTVLALQEIFQRLEAAACLAGPPLAAAAHLHRHARSDTAGDWSEAVPTSLSTHAAFLSVLGVTSSTSGNLPGGSPAADGRANAITLELLFARPTSCQFGSAVSSAGCVVEWLACLLSGLLQLLEAGDGLVAVEAVDLRRVVQRVADARLHRDPCSVTQVLSSFKIARTAADKASAAQS